MENFFKPHCLNAKGSSAGANKGAISRVVRIRCFTFFQETFLVGVILITRAEREIEKNGIIRASPGLSQGCKTSCTDYIKLQMQTSTCTVQSP